MTERYSPEELRAMYPNSPSMGHVPTLAERVGLSSDRRVRAAQLAYPNSESMWPEPLDLDAEAARLEKLYAETAKTWPASAADMIAYEVNSSRNRVITEMAQDQWEIDAMKAELAASQGP